MQDILTTYLFPNSLEQAQNIQKELAEKVITTDQFNLSDLIGGMDVSNRLYDPQKMIYAAATVIKKDTQKLIETKCATQQQLFPYVPGFLGFREAPALVTAYRKLVCQPSVVLVDGHGVSHPRKLGIASHVGVLLDLPTIGVAKTILIGKPSKILGSQAGDFVALEWKQEQIGFLVRTKKQCLPLIVSTGHRVSLLSALEIVLSCINRYRLPEPTRQAHLMANVCRRNS